MLRDSCLERTPASSSSSLRFPMSPFLLDVRFCGRDSGDGAYTGVGARGVRGEVGGLASGAELIECAARLCVDMEGRGAFVVAGCRVFVKVTVTEKGSPAKYEDWAGVTTTRIPVSEFVWEEPGTASMSRRTSSGLAS